MGTDAFLDQLPSTPVLLGSFLLVLIGYFWYRSVLRRRGRIVRYSLSAAGSALASLCIQEDKGFTAGYVK